MNELVVCSLEPWDDIWRRNQFLADRLLRRHPELRLLFVEPPSRPPDVASLRVGPSERLHLLRPLKPVPRAFGPFADAALRAQVRHAWRRLGMRRPVLWVNDTTYAPLGRAHPMLYDITDDWLLAPVSARELTRRHRLERVALEHADEVVVCSPGLASSRSATRRVELIPNGVEVDRFRAPTERPRDLPAAPVAVYVGTLHEARIDVELVVEAAAALPHVRFVMVGPDSMSSTARERLDTPANVVLLGSRPYGAVPAYLQHADAGFVPHRVTAFTESLDPIKAYESLAVGKPVVATPVAGFRDLGPPIVVADRQRFVDALARVLAEQTPIAAPPAGIDWDDRAAAFDAVLAAVSSSTRRATDAQLRPN